MIKEARHMLDQERTLQTIDQSHTIDMRVNHILEIGEDASPKSYRPGKPNISSGIYRTI